MADLEVPVFTPTAEEFRDFSSYVVKIESLCPAGAAIIRPPKGWKPRSNMSYNDVYHLPVRKPIKQHVIGSKGIYYTEHHTQRSRRLNAFIQEAEEFSKEHNRLPKYATEDEIERQYWRNVTFRKPTYGADLPGSLFDDNVCKHWNLKHLNTILDLCPGIPGVSTPYLYLGQYSSTFCFHTEDTDLYGINYLHYGAPKIWYSVPASQRGRFEAMCRQEYPELAHSCTQFMRHKQCLISPEILKKYKLPYGRVAHKEGTFMVVFPGVYHQGYNAGFNIAESINFATLKWLGTGSRSRPCFCRTDSVRLDFGALDRKLFPGKYGRSYVKMQNSINEAMDGMDPLQKRNLRSKNAKRKKRRKIAGEGYDDDGEEEDSFDTDYSNPAAVARELLSPIFAASMRMEGEDPKSEFDQDGFRYPLHFIPSEDGPRTRFVRVDALNRPCGVVQGPVFDPVMSVIDHVIETACEGRKRRPPPVEANPMSEYKLVDCGPEDGEEARKQMELFAEMLAMEQEMQVARALTMWINHCWKEVMDAKTKQKLSLKIARARRLFAKIQDVAFERLPESHRTAKDMVDELIFRATDDTAENLSATLVDELVAEAAGESTYWTNRLPFSRARRRMLKSEAMLTSSILQSMGVTAPSGSAVGARSDLRSLPEVVTKVGPPLQIQQNVRINQAKIHDGRKNYAVRQGIVEPANSTADAILAKLDSVASRDAKNPHLVVSDVSTDSDSNAERNGASSRPTYPQDGRKGTASTNISNSLDSVRLTTKRTWETENVDLKKVKRPRVARPVRRRQTLKRSAVSASPCTKVEEIPVAGRMANNPKKSLTGKTSIPQSSSNRSSLQRGRSFSPAIHQAHVSASTHHVAAGTQNYLPQASTNISQVPGYYSGSQPSYSMHHPWAAPVVHYAPAHPSPSHSYVIPHGARGSYTSCPNYPLHEQAIQNTSYQDPRQNFVGGYQAANQQSYQVHYPPQSQPLSSHQPVSLLQYAFRPSHQFEQQRHDTTQLQSNSYQPQKRASVVQPSQRQVPLHAVQTEQSTPSVQPRQSNELVRVNKAPQISDPRQAAESLQSVKPNHYATSTKAAESSQSLIPPETVSSLVVEPSHATGSLPPVKQARASEPPRISESGQAAKLRASSEEKSNQILQSRKSAESAAATKPGKSVESSKTSKTSKVGDSSQASQATSSSPRRRKSRKSQLSPSAQDSNLLKHSPPLRILRSQKKPQTKDAPAAGSDARNGKSPRTRNSEALSRRPKVERSMHTRQSASKPVLEQSPPFRTLRSRTSAPTITETKVTGRRVRVEHVPIRRSSRISPTLKKKTLYSNAVRKPRHLLLTTKESKSVLPIRRSPRGAAKKNIAKKNTAKKVVASEEPQMTERSLRIMKRQARMRQAALEDIRKSLAHTDDSLAMDMEQNSSLCSYSESDTEFEGQPRFGTNKSSLGSTSTSVDADASKY